jgi:hypothetical protein
MLHLWFQINMGIIIAVLRRLATARANGTVGKQKSKVRYKNNQSQHRKLGHGVINNVVTLCITCCYHINRLFIAYCVSTGRMIGPASEECLVNDILLAYAVQTHCS